MRVYRVYIRVSFLTNSLSLGLSLQLHRTSCMQACTKSWEHGLYIQLASPHNNVIACYGAARMHTLVSWHLVTTNICMQKLQDSLLSAVDPACLRRNRASSNRAVYKGPQKASCGPEFNNLSIYLFTNTCCFPMEVLYISVYIPIYK